LAALDLAFHDLGSTETGPRGLFRLLEHAGAVRRITEPADVERALTAPPAETRAALRSRLIAQAQASGRDYSVDWVSFTVHDLPGSGVESPEVSVRLDDPFAVTDPAAERLLERLRVGWTPSRQL
jgi:proteasome accessory factor A